MANGYVGSELRQITNGWILTLNVATVYAAMSVTLYHPTCAPLSSLVDGLMSTADKWYWEKDGEAKKELDRLCKQHGVAL